MRLDSDEEEAAVKFLKADSTDKLSHKNDGKEDDAGDNVDDENNESRAPRKRSLNGSRASVSNARRHRPWRPRQRQRHSVRTSGAKLPQRPAQGAGRSRTTNGAGRRKGLRHRKKPGGRSRARPRPKVALLADDAAVVIHGDKMSGSALELVRNQTGRKSCKQLTCVEGRGTCVSEEDSGARCRCRLGTAGAFCEQGTCILLHITDLYFHISILAGAQVVNVT